VTVGSRRSWSGRARRVVATVVALVGVVSGATVVATAATAAPAVAAPAVAPGRFVPVSPTRILDTRRGFGAIPLGKPADGGTITVAVTGRSEVTVPSSATAVVLNVTATESTGAGHVTVFPGPTLPVASSVNLERPGQTVAGLVTVPLGPGGRVSMYVQRSVHLVADVFGYFEAAPGGVSAAGRFVAAGPDRVYDSRDVAAVGAGGLRRIPLAAAVPADAVGVVLNVTVTDTAGAGFWTVWPAGQAWPGTSNVNAVAAGQTIANQVIVPVGAAGVDVFAQTGGHVVVDLAGWFTGPSAAPGGDGLFVPVTPTRLLDTRGASNPLGAGAKPFGGWTVEVPVAGRAGMPEQVAAVVATATVVNAKAPGYVTAWPAGQARPGVSTVNAAAAAQTVANHAVVPAGTRGVSLYTQSGAHLLFDVTGWFVGPARTPRFAPVVNPTPPAPQFPGRIVVPRLGLDVALSEGVDDATLQGGPGWWPGTGLPGRPGQLAVFGHRTSATRPFRYLDALVAGDEILLVFDDVTYRYVVDGAEIVDERDFSVLDARADGSSSLILVACHPVGSTAERWVVHAAFDGWWGD
jgi:LPXTG-site transpeptidase (sortase) family protein